MKLSELSPIFLKIITPHEYEEVGVENCDGIRFLCPKCFMANKGPIGTHAIICWKPHVPQTIPPIPGRWNFEGNLIENLTLRAGSSSILLQGERCKAHFFIKNGMIEGA